jgi:hypothetical protein
MPAPLPLGELDEVAEQLLPEMSSSCRGADRDRMHISNRLGLRDKAEQISNDLRSIANYEGRAPKLMDQKRVVQVTSIAVLPKFRQLLKDLIVILLGAERYLYRHFHIRLADFERDTAAD